jgi:hypothetical protein
MCWENELLLGNDWQGQEEKAGLQVVSSCDCNDSFNSASVTCGEHSSYLHLSIRNIRPRKVRNLFTVTQWVCGTAKLECGSSVSRVFAGATELREFNQSTAISYPKSPTKSPTKAGCWEDDPDLCLSFGIPPCPQKRLGRNATGALSEKSQSQSHC